MAGMCAICTMGLSHGLLFRMGVLVFQMPVMMKARNRVEFDHWGHVDTAW